MYAKNKKRKKISFFYIITLLLLFILTIYISLITIPAKGTSEAAGKGGSNILQNAKNSLQLYWFLVPTSTPFPIQNSSPSVQPAPNNPSKNSNSSQPTNKKNNKKQKTPKVNSKGVWPFPKKSPTQFRRIDQGWDLEYNKPTPVYAVEAGKVNLNHGTDPCGFGNYYPLETLDSPIVVNGRKYTELYYGHVHYLAGVIGKHVNPGQQIAYTYPPDLCSGAWPPNWLEMGFWNASRGPVGQGGYPTQAGSDMQKWLNSL